MTEELSSDTEAGEFAHEINERRTELERDNFIHLNMRLTTADRSSLDRLRIKKNRVINFYGATGEALKKRLETELAGIGENDALDIERAASLVNRIATDVQKTFGKEAVWVAVRVSLPNAEFDTPRWHPDGRYFETKEGEKTYKLVAALKGPQTLFGRVIDQKRYRELEEARRQNNRTNEYGSPAHTSEDMRIRVELANTKIIEPTNLPAAEQATVYLVGHRDAMIHSEPPVFEPRIFISVLPGSKEQIEEWRTGHEQQ